MILTVLVHAALGLLLALVAFTSSNALASALFGLCAGVNFGAAAIHYGLRFGGRS